MYKKLLKQYPQVEPMLKEGAWRKYELQDVLGITRGEVDLILSTLTSEGLIKNTSLGWKWND